MPGFLTLLLIWAEHQYRSRGSIIYQVECQIHYIMQCLATMISERIASLDVKDEVNVAYNDKVQAISRTLAWGHPNVESWYKNSLGPGDQQLTVQPAAILGRLPLI